MHSLAYSIEALVVTTIAELVRVVAL